MLALLTKKADWWEKIWSSKGIKYKAGGWIRSLTKIRFLIEWDRVGREEDLGRGTDPWREVDWAPLREAWITRKAIFTKQIPSREPSLQHSQILSNPKHMSMMTTRATITTTKQLIWQGFLLLMEATNQAKPRLDLTIATNTKTTITRLQALGWVTWNNSSSPQLIRKPILQWDQTGSNNPRTKRE